MHTKHAQELCCERLSYMSPHTLAPLTDLRWLLGRLDTSALALRACCVHSLEALNYTLSMHSKGAPNPHQNHSKARHLAGIKSPQTRGVLCPWSYGNTPATYCNSIATHDPTNQRPYHAPHRTIIWVLRQWHVRASNNRLCSCPKRIPKYDENLKSVGKMSYLGVFEYV